MASVPAVAQDELSKTHIRKPQIYLLEGDEHRGFNLVFMPQIEQDSFSTTSSATPPIYTFLKRNDAAPFAGTLMSPGAAAKILGEVEKTDLICRLKIDHETEKVLTSCKSELDLIETILYTEQARNKAAHNQKNAKIKQLSELMDDNKYKWLWAIGGALSGTLLTLGAVHVAN